MNRNAKIGIAAIVGIILLGICACIGLFIYLGGRVMQSLVTDPTEIAQMRQEIAEYDVPEGYTENGMRLFGFKALILSNSSASPESFILMGFPTDTQLTQDEIDKALEQLSQQNQNTVWKQVDTLPVTIQGQSVKMIVSEGSVGEFQQRRMQCFWQGKNSMLVLQITGNVDGWDQELVDAFLASIR